MAVLYAYYMPNIIYECMHIYSCIAIIIYSYSYAWLATIHS